MAHRLVLGAVFAVLPGVMRRELQAALHALAHADLVELADGAPGEWVRAELRYLSLAARVDIGPLLESTAEMAASEPESPRYPHATGLVPADKARK